MLTRIRIEVCADRLDTARNELHAAFGVLSCIGEVTAVTGGEVYEQIDKLPGDPVMSGYRGRLVVAFPVEGAESKVRMEQLQDAIERLGARPVWTYDAEWNVVRVDRGPKVTADADDLVTILALPDGTPSGFVRLPDGRVVEDPRSGR